MKRIPILFLTALFAMPLFAEKVPMPSVDMPTAASNGAGGHHVAYTDNVFSLLVNPAAMMRVQQRSFFTLSPAVMSPQFLKDAVDPIQSMIVDNNMDAFGDLAEALYNKEGKISLGAELREFPFSIAWVANGFGFGLWNRVFVNTNIDGTTLKADIYADVMLPVGFAFKILDLEKHSIDAGITIKPFARVRAADSFDIISDLAGDTDALVDELNIPVIVGGSLSAGLLYRWGGFSAGLTFNDIYSRGQVIYNINSDKTDNNTYYIPFTMNFGLAYEYKLAFVKFALAADWRDVANVFQQDDYLENRNFLLNLGAGLQVSFFDKVSLRAGISEMLPSVGLGVDLGPLKIDAAYYGKELGYEPGMLSTAVLELSLSIRPGAKKRNWAWTRGSVFGLFGIEKEQKEDEEKDSE